jgi:hypothetical protein
MISQLGECFGYADRRKNKNRYVMGYAYHYSGGNSRYITRGVQLGETMLPYMEAAAEFIE